MNAFQHDRLCTMVRDLLNFISDIRYGYYEYDNISDAYSFLPEKMQEDLENGKEITFKQVMEYLETRRSQLYECDDSFVWGE